MSDGRRWLLLLVLAACARDPAPPAPPPPAGTCASASDCELTQDQPCCTECCPPEPRAIERRAHQVARSECARRECKMALCPPGPCPKVHAVGDYVVGCDAGRCVGTLKPDAPPPRELQR